MYKGINRFKKNKVNLHLYTHTYKLKPCMIYVLQMQQNKKEPQKEFVVIKISVESII